MPPTELGRNTPFTWDRAVAVGAGMWAATVALGIDGSTSALGVALLLLGSTVVVPLALSLVDPGSPVGRFVVARWLHLLTAASLAVSFLLAPGPLAGALSLPWLAFTFFVALLGGLRFFERGGGPLNEVAVDVGMVLLAVGGIWTAASRFGAGLMGFSEPIVLLTGAHFHFAGLALPVATGLAVRLRPGLFGNVVSAIVAVGVPFVAAGITAGADGWATVEWLASLWMAVGGLLAAWIFLGSARRTPRVASILLIVAAAALAAGMVLVIVYATGVRLGAPILSIPAMLRTHAPINAVGFALTALVALRLSSLPDGPMGMELLLPLFGDKASIERWRERAFGPEARSDDRFFTEDRHEVELPAESAGRPVPGGSFEIAAHAIVRYRTFPPDILLGLRDDPDAPVAVGETICADYRILPGLHVAFAARVVDTIDASDGVEQKAGFRYRTLAGHPVCGEETFYVRKEIATGRVFAGLFARSRPDMWIVRILRPAARRRQLAAGRAGAANLQRLVQEAKPNAS